MHINLLFRKVLYVFFSFLIIIAPTIQMAQAASNWKPTSAKSFGSRVVIGATNGGYKSAINIPPNLGKIVKFGMKGANAVGLIQIAASLINDGVDFVMDPANNSVKYKVPSDAPAEPYVYGTSTILGNKRFSTRLEAAEAFCAYFSSNLRGFDPVTGSSISCYSASGLIEARGEVRKYSNPSYDPNTPAYTEKSLSLADLAPQIVKDAQSSNTQKRAAAQKILQDVATAAVIAGDYDADFLAGAVPINDTKPLIPAVPGSQVGDVDAGMQGGEVGAAAEQAREEADKARKQAEAAKDAATAAAEEARRLNDEAKDLINTNIDQAIKDAATAAAAQAAKDAADAKSVADAAAAEAARVASEAARAAEKAVAAANEKAAAAEKAAADAAADASKSDVEKAAAQAAADAAKAEAAAAQARAEAAEKAAADAAAAKPEAKPFELPAFCSWATPVCDYIDWVKTEYSDMKSWVRSDPLEGVDENVDIQDAMIDGWQDKANAGYVSFSSQCPSDVLIPVELMGASQTLNISYTPFCHFASLIKPAVILGAWISGLLIISGGRGRE